MMETPQRVLRGPRGSLPLGGKTHLAGVLNLTPDSFSDGGRFFDAGAAEKRFFEMVEEGAAVVDIGGESTRPGHVPVPAGEEMERVLPFLQRIRGRTGALISVDTSKAEVAEAALKAGADWINDVWGAQRDPDMAGVVARHGGACVLMHNRPRGEAGSGEMIATILRFWKESVRRVREAGVREESIVLDPGLGFGKTYEENWEIMRRLGELRAAGYPLLLGASRKSMLAKLLHLENPDDRLYGTLATTALAVDAGIDFVRVHDIRPNRECAEVMDYCRRRER